MKKEAIILFFLAAGLASAGNFLVNGAFEQDLSVGWTSYMADPTYGYDSIIRGTGYDPDADYEVFTMSTFSYLTKLSQIVDIPSTANFTFAIKAKVVSFDNDYDTLCWAASAVKVSYLNSTGTVLGETRICMFSAPCPWASTSTMHLIQAADTLWHNYSFVLNTELANLPGVTPSQVKKIEVALFDTTYHSC
jgi:hypothetical protein